MDTHRRGSVQAAHTPYGVNYLYKREFVAEEYVLNLCSQILAGVTFSDFYLLTYCSKRKGGLNEMIHYLNQMEY